MLRIEVVYVNTIEGVWSIFLCWNCFFSIWRLFNVKKRWRSQWSNIFFLEKE